MWQLIFRYGGRLLVALAGAAAIDGVVKKSDARKVVTKASGVRDEALAASSKAVERTNSRAADYGRQQARLRADVVGRLVTFLEQNATSVSRADFALLRGFDVGPTQLAEYKAMAVKADEVLATLAKSASAAMFAYQGTMSLATAVGSASTGTALTELSGEAARRATLAYLGGGSLVTGGGGMAAGEAVLQGLAGGAGLAVSALVFNSHAERDLTAAHEYEAEVTQAAARLNEFRLRLSVIRRRIDELAKVLGGLERRAVRLLTQLEATPYSHELHEGVLANAVQIVRSLVQVAQAPLLLPSGELNPDTHEIVAMYGS